jgi:membrane-bound lytic murein transglycosylase D
VPSGKGPASLEVIDRLAIERGEKYTTYVTKAGEVLPELAERTRVPAAKIIELNHLHVTKGAPEPLPAGTVLLLPHNALAAPVVEGKPIAVVPASTPSFPSAHTRVFHRSNHAETLQSIAELYNLQPMDLIEWNQLEPMAKLQDGMLLQVFLPPGYDFKDKPVLREDEARVIVVGSDEFLKMFELKGRKRIVVQARPGDTLSKIATERHVSAPLLERINRKNRTDVLPTGSQVVLYVE